MPNFSSDNSIYKQVIQKYCAETKESLSVREIDFSDKLSADSFIREFCERACGSNHLISELERIDVFVKSKLHLSMKVRDGKVLTSSKTMEEELSEYCQ